MRAIQLTIAISVLLVGVNAAETVANITSSGTFALRGVPVKTQGIPSWPMVLGDELATDKSVASIRFVDGSVVTLAQNSKAQVTKKDGKLTLRLVNGSMQFKLAEGSGLVLTNNNQPVSGVSGSVSAGQVTGTEKAILAGRPAPPPPTSSK
jgi:ferric-dicitrate binding protein FerR (iron transport regulator)